MSVEKNSVIEEREVNESELKELFSENSQEEKFAAGTEEDDKQVADLEAAADAVSAENPAFDLDKIGYTVTFAKEYNFEGKRIKDLDLSGLEDLTTIDAQEIDRIMAKLNHHPQSKFKDTLFCKHVAMRVTGLPVEFFNCLRWKDMNEVTSRIALYFLYK